MLVNGVSPTIGFDRAETYRRRSYTWEIVRFGGGRFIANAIHGNIIDVRVAYVRRYALETAESHARRV